MEDRIKLSYFYGREADQEDIRGGKSVIWSYAGSYVIIHEKSVV